MSGKDLLARLKRLATKRNWPFIEKPGHGAHRKVWLNGRRSVIPIHGGDLAPGTFHKIKKDLDILDRDLEV